MEPSVFNKLDMMEEFRKFKDEVEANFLTINIVCKEAGVNATVVSRWNTGKHKPSPHILNKLRAAFKRIIEKRDNRKNDV